MQFPYPRNSSPSSKTRRSSRTSAFIRRRSFKTVAILLVGAFAVVFLLLRLLSGAAEDLSLPFGTPPVVIVTTIDPKMSETHKNNLIENRRHYAARHGYATFFPNTTDYDLMPGVPHTWSTLPAMRHAMTLYPRTPWLWYLSNTALIMNPSRDLHQQVLDPAVLEAMMIVDQPVVPPDSIIKTFSHLRPERVDFILTQDFEGLAGGSFLLRSGDWARYFLDAWFDPLYRSYNFQNAEGHALEHIVQWHGTILAKLALIPQRVLNSYTKDSKAPTGIYVEGDFVANFHGCFRDPTRHCDREMAPLMSRWRELRDNVRRR